METKIKKGESKIDSIFSNNIFIIAMIFMVFTSSMIFFSEAVGGKVGIFAGSFLIMLIAFGLMVYFSNKTQRFIMRKPQEGEIVNILFTEKVIFREKESTFVLYKVEDTLYEYIYFKRYFYLEKGKHIVLKEGIGSFQKV